MDRVIMYKISSTMTCLLSPNVRYLYISINILFFFIVQLPFFVTEGLKQWCEYDLSSSFTVVFINILLTVVVY